MTNDDSQNGDDLVFTSASDVEDDASTRRETSGFHSPLTSQQATGGFQSPPTGQHATGGFQSPPTGQHATGGFQSPPTGQHATGGFQSPPTGQHATGGFQSPPTGQHATGGFQSPPTGQHATGGFQSPPTGQHATGGPATGPHAFSTTGSSLKAVSQVSGQMRVAYGAAGFIVGAISGLALGLLNSALEGVTLFDGLGLTLQISGWFAILFGVVCAWKPERVVSMLRQWGVVD